MTTVQTPAVESLARKDEGVMDDDDFQKVVKDAITQAVQYTDELSTDRTTASEYYAGKPFGNEEAGRSQAILTEVRDAVDGMLPSILRVVHGPEHCVEFIPTTGAGVQLAEQQTDYVRYVYEEDNSGVRRSTEVLKDGFIRRLGIFKWGWETGETKAFKQEGMTREDLDLLAAMPDVTPTIIKKRKDGTLDVEFTQTDPEGRARVWAVPPEEFAFNRGARTLDDATIVLHRTEKTRGQLVAMGVTEKQLDEHGQPGTGRSFDAPEEQVRREMAAVGRSSSVGAGSEQPLGKANDKIIYTEAWLTVDFDGDGFAELRRVCTIGAQYYPVKNVPAHERPFALFTPYPEPHTVIGGSVADRTMDVQKINSSILRAMLDSGAASIFPRTVYLEGQASVADIMNTAIGAPIRERTLNAVRVLEMPYTGEKMMPMLAFMQDVIERRTGRNKGAAGLDMDALQSTGKEAVGAVLTGSQEQLEVIAREFAETLKVLFRGVARLLTEHKPKTRVVRLRGKWTDITPADWGGNLDVTVNVALGSTFTEKKVATLMSVAADQKDIMMNMGIANPIVTLPMLGNTRAKILKLQGLPDTESYYNTLPMDWQPPPPPPPQPDPEQMWIQAEKEMNHMKTMKELSIKTDELAFEREKEAFNQEFKIRELAQKLEIEKYKVDAANSQASSDAALKAAIDEEAKETEFALQAHQQMHDQHLQRDKQEHEKAMAERAAETAEKATKETAAKEKKKEKQEPPVVHVAPPQVHITNTPASSKRKARIKKMKDGSFEMESD